MLLTPSPPVTADWASAGPSSANWMLSLPMGTGLPRCGTQGYVSAQEPWGGGIIPLGDQRGHVVKGGEHEEGKGEEHGETKHSDPVPMGSRTDSVSFKHCPSLILWFLLNV